MLFGCPVSSESRGEELGCLFQLDRLLSKRQQPRCRLLWQMPAACAAVVWGVQYSLCCRNACSSSSLCNGRVSTNPGVYKSWLCLATGLQSARKGTGLFVGAVGLAGKPCLCVCILYGWARERKPCEHQMKLCIARCICKSRERGREGYMK